MPKAFLLEVLEWNEALEEAREAPAGSPPRARLEALTGELERARGEALERLGALLTPLPPDGAPQLTEARRELNALRYLRPHPGPDREPAPGAGLAPLIPAPRAPWATSS